MPITTSNITSQQMEKMVKLLSRKKQQHYSQFSPVAVNYFSNGNSNSNNPLLNKSYFRDHYYLDQGTVSIILNIKEEEYIGSEYQETSLHDYVGFLNRLDNNGYIVKITREKL
jgi:hypothetical protein